MLMLGDIRLSKCQSPERVELTWEMVSLPFPVILKSKPRKMHFVGISIFRFCQTSGGLTLHENVLGRSLCMRLPICARSVRVTTSGDWAVLFCWKIKHLFWGPHESLVTGTKETKLEKSMQSGTRTDAATSLQIAALICLLDPVGSGSPC